MTNKEQFEKWQKRITKAEKAYQEYHDLIDEIRKYYKNDNKRNKNNIFWSSIETLKPFLYFKAPKVYVERKSKQQNEIESLAAGILEKGLEWDLAQFDFDGVIKYARNDYLLSGAGVLLERYVPSFVDVGGVEIVSDEKVETVYIDPKDFIADSEKVGVWEDVTWVARIIHMTKTEVKAQFELPKLPFDDDDEDKDTKVYEIWDKKGKKVLYICNEYPNLILRITDMPDLANGLPMPKPILTTTTNDSIIPVPDYSEIKSLLDELDGINNRMRLTMQAVKVSGCYDNSFPELANILDKDVTLLSVSDFSKLKDAGGLAGIIDFMPIAQYIDALAAMAQRRIEVVQNIYEITGVSDIMRGNSDPSETATAVQKKTNFGTLRNQDRQNDMQRFITDLLKIKAEMICEMFSVDKLAQFADGNSDAQKVMAAIALLKEDKTRNLVIGIETDTGFNQDNTQEKALEVVRVINDMITAAFEKISAQPALLPLYRQMIESVIITLPNARQFEPVMEDVFNRITADLAQPDQPDEKAMAEMAKNQLQAQKNQNEFAIKQEQNAIKRDELMLKNEVEQRKLDLTQEEMDAQVGLKTAELAIKGETNENVTTGMVGGF